MRSPGTASVEEHPKGSGKFRVRARIDGKLRTIKSNLDEAHALEIADAYAVVRDESVVREGLTLEQFAQAALDRRERRDVRGIKQERDRWRAYVSNSPLGRMAITAIRRKHILDWRDNLRRKGSRVPLAFQTKTNALNLLRSVLADALDREVIASNPALEVRVPKGEDRKTEEDLSGVLRPEEQVRLVSACPEKSQPIVLFALLTGLRLSEQWWLRWEDIQGQTMRVRRSVGGKSTKGRRVRKIELPAPAVEILASLPRTSAWVFPAPRGGRRHYGHRPSGWREAVKACNFGRQVRWHDLRHTCATSLLGGWWGRKWSLEEVRGYMGHSSVKVTERYARILDEMVTEAVLGTFPERSQDSEESSVFEALFSWRRGWDSNPRWTVLQSGALSNDSAAVEPEAFPGGNGNSQTVTEDGSESEPEDPDSRGGLVALPLTVSLLAFTAHRLGVLPANRQELEARHG